MIRGYDEFELLGRGGFATVYRARQIGLPRQVAVKILDARNADERQIELFTRECMAMASLSGHPHVVEVYDAGTTDEGRPYLAMQLLPGGSLADAISGGPMPLGAAVQHMADVADALDSAHSLGVLHRDIKPANILIDRRGRARLADFGIARMADSSTTAQGAIGTPLFMAPEVLDGGRASAASDIYGLGATLVTVLHGRHPFDEGEGAYGSLWRLISGPAPTAPEGTPAVVADIVDRCVAKDPAQRFASAAEVHEALATAVATLASEGPGDITRVTGPPSSAAPAALGPPTPVSVLPDPAVEPAVTTHPQPPGPTPVVPRRRRRTFVGAAIVAAVLLIAGTALALTNRDDPDPDQASEDAAEIDADATSLVEDRVDQADVGIDRRYDLVDDGSEVKVSTTLTNDADAAVERIWFEVVPTELAQSLDEVMVTPRQDGSVEERNLLYWVVPLAARSSATVSWTAPVPAGVEADARYLDRLRRLQRNATLNAEDAIAYTTATLEQTTDAVAVAPTAGEGGASSGGSESVAAGPGGEGGSDGTGSSGGGSGEGSGGGDESAVGATTATVGGSGGSGPQPQGPPPNRAPTVTVANQLHDELASVRYSIGATDPDGDPLAISVSGLPPGLTADGATISGVIGHTASSATTHRSSIRSTPRTVTVTVDDRRGGRVSRTFTWTVRDTHVAMQDYVDEYGCARGPSCNSTNTLDVAAISQAQPFACAYVPGASNERIHRQSERPGTVIRWGARVTYWYAKDDPTCPTVAKGWP